VWRWLWGWVCRWALTDRISYSAMCTDVRVPLCREMEGMIPAQRKPDEASRSGYGLVKSEDGQCGSGVERGLFAWIPA
jgi:hypothetical protein